MVDFRKLVKAGVHFGHQTSRWNPKMAPYIWGFKNKVHLIDVSKTAYQLEAAAKFLESTVTDGKIILWVGTKKPAQKIIEAVAHKLEMPYVSHRWIGGTLSNFEQVKKARTKLLHYEDILAKSEKTAYHTKKELVVFQKMVDRLEKSVGGIRNLKWPVGAIVIIDAGKEFSALREANAMGVPVVALVDTNCDPSLVDYVIPGNDDAASSIQEVVSYLAEAVEKGKLALVKKAEAKLEEAKAERAEEAAKREEARAAAKAASAKKLAERKATAAVTATPAVEEVKTSE